MSLFADVIKNLYEKGKVDSTKIYEFLTNGKITKEEYLTILGKGKNNE